MMNTPEINKLRFYVKPLILKALRSGEYRFSRSGGLLEEQNGTYLYDVQGVICDLFVRQGLGYWDKVGDQVGCFCYMSHNFEVEYLPEEVVQWAFQGNQWLYFEDGQTLAEKWDEGVSELEIADLIEAQW
jgi:hypothetical protein